MATPATPAAAIVARNAGAKTSTTLRACRKNASIAASTRATQTAVTRARSARSASFSAAIVARLPVSATASPGP
jgi:hypothetical protein